MQIQLNTDNNVEVGVELLQRVEADIESALSRFGDQITRVEIHVSDENAQKSGGADKRCVLEARAVGQQPVAVTHNAASVGEACDGALRKLEALLATKSGRSDSSKGGQSIRHMQVKEGLS